MTSPGYTSIRISTGSPTLMLVSCVSRKLAWTHRVSATNEITCVPGDTSCPGLTCRSPTVPSGGAPDAGVPQFDLAGADSSLPREQVRANLRLLRLQHRLRATFGLDSQLVAAEQRAR